MYFTSLLVVAALAGPAMAQRPSDTSICDYYTTALLKNNTAENQATVLTLLVNTAVIGNYTKPVIDGITWPDVKVPGILANGSVDGKDVSLLPFFNGAMASTNTGGSAGTNVNFLDDGGAAPLMLNKPANGTTSRQYKLLTHLYAYFGALLGCTLQGDDSSPFPTYSGNPSQHNVHKYMNLSAAEFTYFVTQVGLSARSFGVADDDVTAVGKSLADTFGKKCSRDDVVVVKGQSGANQAICNGEGCPVAEGADAAVCAMNNGTTGHGNVSATSSSKGAAAATGMTGAGGAVAAGLGMLAMFV